MNWLKSILAAIGIIRELAPVVRDIATGRPAKRERVDAKPLSRDELYRDAEERDR